ncbi:MAG TPA: shikimate dehydrogenase [Chitinophagaceae bacterium]|nr:shikimate dehydrogenase [Chitinophagaceae bacterium]
MKLYGLIGRPLKHSFSKAYFTEKFAREGIIDCLYENLELKNISLLSTFSKAHPELCGLNVTIPYKKEVLSFLHANNKIVEAVGACNCIKIEAGRWVGYNTDVIGFKQALQPFLKPHHTAALILGTGGSSGAVQYALQELGITFKRVSRHESQSSITYAQLDQTILKAHTIIINTTPVGMFPNTEAAPKIPYGFVTPDHLLFDLIYNPAKTLFLQRGEAQGATIANGYQMLLLQAEESWRIWNS